MFKIDPPRMMKPSDHEANSSDDEALSANNANNTNWARDRIDWSARSPCTKRRAYRCVLVTWVAPQVLQD